MVLPAHFCILHAETGDVLWRKPLGGMIASGPMIGGRQYVALGAEHSAFVFALEEGPCPSPGIRRACRTKGAETTL